jgi:hypothetical protein
VVQRTGNDVGMQEARDHWYHDITSSQPETCPAEPMNAEDPLFYSLYFWVYRKTEGCLAYFWWVSCVRVHDAQICL